MRTRKFAETLTIAVSSEQRAALDAIANQKQDSVGAVLRELLDEGIRTRGLVDA